MEATGLGTCRLVNAEAYTSAPYTYLISRVPIRYYELGFIKKTPANRLKLQACRPDTLGAKTVARGHQKRGDQISDWKRQYEVTSLPAAWAWTFMPLLTNPSSGAWSFLTLLFAGFLLLLIDELQGNGKRFLWVQQAFPATKCRSWFLSGFQSRGTFGARARSRLFFLFGPVRNHQVPVLDSLPLLQT